MRSGELRVGILRALPDIVSVPGGGRLEPIPAMGRNELLAMAQNEDESGCKMKPTKACEKCGLPYQIEPGLQFKSLYCLECRKVLALMIRKHEMNVRGNGTC